MRHGRDLARISYIMGRLTVRALPTSRRLRVSSSPLQLLSQASQLSRLTFLHDMLFLRRVCSHKVLRRQGPFAQFQVRKLSDRSFETVQVPCGGSGNLTVE